MNQSNDCTPASHVHPRCDAGLAPSPGLIAAWIPAILTLLLAFAALSFWRHVGVPLFDRFAAISAPASTTPSEEVSTDPQVELAEIFTPEVLYWRSDILRWAHEYGLDPNLIATVMQIESCGHPEVSSSAGALGLFQVMPFHFGSDEDPLDPETNARRGLAYLARSVDLSAGRPDLALAGYNGGHGQIQRSPTQWPDETQRYVAWGFGILGDIADGKAESVVLQDWLDAGGESLCARASQSLALMAEE